MKIRSTYSMQGKSMRHGTVTQWQLFEKEDFLSCMRVFHNNILDVGKALEPHEHEQEEQLFFIISGVGEMTVGDEKQIVREGDGIYLPPRIPHTMKNIGTFPLRFIAVGAEIK